MKKQEFPFPKPLKNLKNIFKNLPLCLALAFLFQTSVLAMHNPWIELELDPAVKYTPLPIPHSEKGDLLTTPPQPPTKDRSQACMKYEGDPRGIKEILLMPGADRRMRVPATDKWPYSVHAQLDIKAPGGSFGGSGTLVGPHHVLTAAHCVHDLDKMGGFAQRIIIHPALNDAVAPYGAFRAAKVCLYKE